MATHVKFDKFSAELYSTRALDPDYYNLLIALTNTAPDTANDEFQSDLVLIDDTYLTYPPMPGSFTQNYLDGINYSLLDDITLSATGGSVGPFRYIAFCDDSGADYLNKLICYYDFGYSITLQDGQNLILNFSTKKFSKGVFITVQ